MRCVCRLSVGTEEIAKFWYGKLETCPEIAGMGIYLKTSGPSFLLFTNFIYIYIYIFFLKLLNTHTPRKHPHAHAPH